MMNLLTSQRLSLVRTLLLISLFLCVVLALEWRYPRSASSELGQSDNALVPISHIPDIEDFSLPTIESYAELTARPLFIEGRRPLATEQSADADADGGKTEQQLAIERMRQMADLEAKLMGVIITPDGMQVLMTGEEGKYIKVKKGEEVVSGWRVTAIYEDRVTVTSGVGSRSLYLHKPKPKRAAPERPVATTRVKRQPKHVGDEDEETNVRVRRNRIRPNEMQDEEQQDDMAEDEPGALDDSE